jgi:hypothetical protein
MMRTFIQLRGGIGYAVINTTGEPDHSTTPDHTTAIEVFTADPDQFLRKAYNAETGTWYDAPVIRFAEVNEFGDIMEIRRTVFAHEVPSDAVELPSDANAQWKFIDGAWVAPVYVVAPEPQVVESDGVIHTHE